MHLSSHGEQKPEVAQDHAGRLGGYIVSQMSERGSRMTFVIPTNLFIRLYVGEVLRAPGVLMERERDKERASPNPKVSYRLGASRER